MKPLRDVGLEELRKLEEEARVRCSVCKSGKPPAGHHHHFCLQCAYVIPADEDATHGKDSIRLSSGEVETHHPIQFCPLCAPPRELDPTSTTARHAEALFERFGAMAASALEAERLLAIKRSWTGTERIVPRETWPPIQSGVEWMLPRFEARIDPGLRLALHPLGLMPSTILEDHGPRVLGHPFVWNAFRNLVTMANLEDSRGEAARHEIRTIASLLVGDRKPIRRPGRDFDRWLLSEFERLQREGMSVMDAYSDLVNRSGLSLLNVQRRLSRERDRTGKRKKRYIERKGPARGKGRR